MHHRRALLQTALSSLAAFGLSTRSGLAHALPAAALQFPRDHGAHLDFRTEWWYVTGFANTAQGDATYGFQVTFFRSRIAATQNMRSSLAARHLLFAHAAITDVAGKKLWHDQRIARWSGRPFGSNTTELAAASTSGMDIALRDWRLRESDRDGTSPGQQLAATVQSEAFGLNLRLKPSQPVLLQGKQGLSRKGPDPGQASYYYSRPQLQAQGTLSVQGRTLELRDGSTAWLDHEWSQELLHPDAVGWDWIGVNLDDGSALTAFRLRDGKGIALWDGGSFRTKSGTLTVFSRGDVVFKPLRVWRSGLSGAVYPVEWAVQTPAGVYTLKALLDNQELDSRASTGAIYWEGLCEVADSKARLVGRGYLEMTGYAAALKLS